jgi:hypothetical protein
MKYAGRQFILQLALILASATAIAATPPRLNAEWRCDARMGGGTLEILAQDFPSGGIEIYISPTNNYLGGTDGRWFGMQIGAGSGPPFVIGTLALYERNYTISAVNPVVQLTESFAVAACKRIDIEIGPYITPPSFSNPKEDVNKTGQLRNIRVALLSDQFLDTTRQIQTASIRVGNAKMSVGPKNCFSGHHDINKDGLQDLVCIFDLQTIPWVVSDTAYLQAVSDIGDIVGSASFWLGKNLEY